MEQAQLSNSHGIESPLFHRTHPFPAKIKERRPLTKSGSSKSTFHLTLDIAGSGLVHQVGDSVGIYASNDPLLVSRIISTLKVDPSTPVQHPRTGVMFTLQEFLEKQANLSRITTPLLKQFQSHPKAWSILQDPSKIQETLALSDFLDIALLFGDSSFDLIQLISCLPPLLPRFYSVASSQKLYPGTIDLIVSLTSFQHRSETRYGVASHFLCHRADVQTTLIPCYVQHAPHFTLPSDPATPIIMVGPGTGVAPFRAFLQERLYYNSPGKNWLFFGERNQKTDFFYEEFWSSLVAQQKLSLDLAFSRDQAHKLYVQHKLLEKGRDVWSWLEQGAFFYVCGDADPMAKEVEAAVLQICCTHGHLSFDEAKAYLKKMRHEKRYLSDVY